MQRLGNNPHCGMMPDQLDHGRIIRRHVHVLHTVCLKHVAHVRKIRLYRQARGSRGRLFE